MLPLVVVQEVRQLLDEKVLSHRKIANILGVSRGTVGAIASGRRGIYGSVPSSEEPTLCCFEMPPERCPGCGSRVYMPCVLCSARAYQQRRKQWQNIPSPRRVA